MERYFNKIQCSDNEECQSESDGSSNSKMHGIPREDQLECSSSTDSNTNSESAECKGKKRKISKSMRIYKQKVRKAWLKDKRLKDWIAEDESKIFCKFCSCKLQPKLCGLVAHSKTSKHISAAAALLKGNQPVLPFKPSKIDVNVKKAELSNAVYVAVHTAIQSVDHLSKLQKNSFCDSEIAAEIKLGRTKCGALIKNVLSPYFQKRLLADIGNNNFSLIIDESTDISVNKYLGIVIRYYSINTKLIVNTFLKLVELEDFTAKGLVTSILKTLQDFGLDVKKCKGLGTDNASVMTGINKGVIGLLKQHNPSIVLVPCVCHSIQLAVSYASKFIPNEIEFLVAETYNWFAKSSGRQMSYANIYAAINDGLEPLKMVRSCATRWLSIEVAVKRILTQWLELKTQFKIAAVAECCHKAQLLTNLYNDTNLAYLQFLWPVLQEVQKVNKLFESNTADPLKIFSELKILLSFLCFLVVPRSEDFDPLSSPLINSITVLHFHYSFENFIQKKIQENVFDINTEKIIRENCRTFLFNLIEQLRQRLPSNIDTLKKIDFFSVENALKVVKPKIFDHLENEKFKYSSDEITAIEMQWQSLTFYQWINLQSTVEFWAEVRELKNAIGKSPFNELSKFIFNFLILPLSNAEVERIFSSMNIVKTKLRNRLKIKMLNSLLCVRCGLKREGKCCDNFIIELDLIRLMNTCDIYSDSTDEEEYIIGDI